MKTWILLGLVSALAFSGCVEEGYGSYSAEDRSHHERTHSHEGEETEEPGEGVTVEDCDEAYPDADPRFNSHIDGKETATRTIPVERSGDLIFSYERPLKVSAIFTITGTVLIELRDPDNKVVRSESFQGHKELEEEDWFSTQHARAGDWSLVIQINEEIAGVNPTGAYTFGAQAG